MVGTDDLIYVLTAQPDYMMQEITGTPIRYISADFYVDLQFHEV